MQLFPGRADAGIAFVRVFDRQPWEQYHPYDAATDELGNVYVVDYGHYLVKYDDKGHQIWRTGGPGEEDGNLFYPEGVAYGNGQVYVADTAHDKIHVFTTGGTYVSSFGGTGSGEGKFNAPNGIAVSPDGCGGDIFVTDAMNHNVSQFTAGGTFTRSWGSFGDGTDQLKVPSGVDVDDACLVYVTNQYGHDRADNAGVMIFNPAFGDNAVGFFPVDGIGGVESFPDGIAVNPDGSTIWVAESNTHRISRFDRTGGSSYEYKSSFGGGAGSNLESPHGVALNQQGHLFVTNTNLDMIWEYEDAPSKLRVLANKKHKYILDTQGLWFALAYNQVDQTCQITGRMTVDVPGHDPFKVDGDMEVPDNFVDLKLDLSGKQTKWLKKAWNAGMKVGVSGKFSGPCTDDVTITKKYDEKF